MTRDDIYDHLAQVYLGKRKKEDTRKSKQFHVWLVINVVTTGIIFSSAFYGLTAFLTRQSTHLEKKIVYSLHNGPIRVNYNFVDSLIPTKEFSLSIPTMDVSKYQHVNFSVRGKEEGSPGVIKVVIRNQKNEAAYYYVQGVDLDWHKFSIPLEDFKQITDWSDLKDISFVLESWNVDKKKGLILIDEVRFSGVHKEPS